MRGSIAGSTFTLVMEQQVPNLKASELRIGNWIQDSNAKGRSCRVLRLNSGSEFPITYHYEKAFEYSPRLGEGLEGIPISEEWLVKFGFEKSGSIYYSKLEFTVYFDSIHELAVTIEVKDVDYQIYLKTIQFVHQLQNLYIALTSEELQLKPQTV